MSTQVQSVLFDRDIYSLTEAKKWLRDNDFIAPKVDKTDRYLRFRQKEPNYFNESSFRTIPFGKDTGIKAIIGVPMKGNPFYAELNEGGDGHRVGAYAMLFTKAKKEWERTGDPLELAKAKQYWEQYQYARKTYTPIEERRGYDPLLHEYDSFENAIKTKLPKRNNPMKTHKNPVIEGKTIVENLKGLRKKIERKSFKDSVSSIMKELRKLNSLGIRASVYEASGKGYLSDYDKKETSYKIALFNSSMGTLLLIAVPKKGSRLVYLNAPFYETRISIDEDPSYDIFQEVEIVSDALLKDSSFTVEDEDTFAYHPNPHCYNDGTKKNPKFDFKTIIEVSQKKTRDLQRHATYIFVFESSDGSYKDVSMKVWLDSKLPNRSSSYLESQMKNILLHKARKNLSFGRLIDFNREKTFENQMLWLYDNGIKVTKKGISSRSFDRRNPNNPHCYNDGTKKNPHCNVHGNPKNPHCNVRENPYGSAYASRNMLSRLNPSKKIMSFESFMDNLDDGNVFVGRYVIFVQDGVPMRLEVGSSTPRKVSPEVAFYADLAGQAELVGHSDIDALSDDYRGLIQQARSVSKIFPRDKMEDWVRTFPRDKRIEKEEVYTPDFDFSKKPRMSMEALAKATAKFREPKPTKTTTKDESRALDFANQISDTIDGSVLRATEGDVEGIETNKQVINDIFKMFLSKELPFTEKVMKAIQKAVGSKAKKLTTLHKKALMKIPEVIEKELGIKVEVQDEDGGKSTPAIEADKEVKQVIIEVVEEKAKGEPAVDPFMEQFKKMMEQQEQALKMLKNPMGKHYAFPMTSADHNRLYDETKLNNVYIKKNPSNDFKFPQTEVNGVMIDNDIYSWLNTLLPDWGLLIQIARTNGKDQYIPMIQQALDQKNELIVQMQKTTVPAIEEKVRKQLSSGKTLTEIIGKSKKNPMRMSRKNASRRSMRYY